MCFYFLYHPKVENLYSVLQVPFTLRVLKSQFSALFSFILCFNYWLTKVIAEGEILLSASSARRAVRRNLGPEDDKPLGLKIDGFWRSPGNSDYEIGMLEISGGHLTNDLPRYLKDHVCGFWGMRDLLDYIAGKLSKGDISIMRKLHIWFIHVYEHEIQVWSMDLPASGIYHMTLIDKISLPIN
ncbi:hypothetical protein BC936DRAFT_148889 [Jimgerdemannia flammicorona]|uniref:Uncharacterized protein n=1 Tax=Jimgerdemannia flammicorona TaxID=994334 RepID=A0A433D282_9FUNG|nr:hypothetical protein BC936DRAFT_148889 [Jimgerdemannia flammicorona]